MASSPIADSAVRLLLPDGKPARGIFPGLASDLDTPVYAACSFSPSSPADNARQNLTCPVGPSEGAQTRLRQCQASKCAMLMVEMDHEASRAQGYSESWWVRDVRNALSAAARLNDCTLTHCTTEFWAAHGSLCISLDAPILRNPGVTLPQLPATAPESLRQLHQDHLASRRNPNPNAPSTTPNAADTLKLGICAPVPPIGTPCEPAQVNTDGTFTGSIGIPQLDPMPRSIILSRALPPGSAWPRVVEGNELAPVRLFQAMPFELKASAARASVAMNLMSLTACSDAKLTVAAKGAGETCQKTSDCRFGECQGSMGPTGTSTRTCALIVPVATRNLAVNFNSGPGSQAPPMATTSLPPWGGSFSPSSDPFSGGALVIFLFAALGSSMLMLMIGCMRAGTRSKSLQAAEPRPLYASEVRGGRPAGNQRGTGGAIELGQRARPPSAPQRTAARPTAGTTQRPVDPDLDEPLPRYVP